MQHDLKDVEENTRIIQCFKSCKIYEISQITTPLNAFLLCFLNSLHSYLKMV